MRYGAARSSPALPRRWDANVEAYVRIDQVELADGTFGHRVRPDITRRERAACVRPLSGVILNVQCPTPIPRATDALFEEGDQLLLERHPP
jgi:hypothetical protein